MTSRDLVLLFSNKKIKKNNCSSVSGVNNCSLLEGLVIRTYFDMFVNIYKDVIHLSIFSR